MNCISKLQLLPASFGCQNNKTMAANDPEQWESVFPAPFEPTKPDYASALWVYRDAEGRPLMARFRVEEPDGKKTILPFTYGRRVWTDKAGNRQDKTGWHVKEGKVPLPLYGLDHLARHPEWSVLIVEGEKTADAARLLFTDYVVMTSQGGCNGAYRNDWTILAGRKVTIWPDADQAGEKYAETVINLLYQNKASSVRKVILPEALPSGWDLADSVPFVLLKDKETPKDFLKNLLDQAVDTQKAVKVFYPYGYVMKAEGLYYTFPEKDDISPIRICDWFNILGETEDENGANCGLFITWHNSSSGRKHQYSIPRSLIHSSGNEIAATLEDRGLSCNIQARKLLLSFISRVRTDHLLRSTNRTGWHMLNQQPLFVLADGQVFGNVKGSNDLILQTGHITTAHSFHCQGSLSQWQDHLACYTVGNSRLLFFLCAALAGPLLESSLISGGGLHLIGKSQTGKSTALFVAASVWGKGTRGGQVRSWRNTANGLEGIASETSDTCLILDELGEASAKEVGDMIYMLANGMGKTRSNRYGEARAVKNWRSIFLSSGEISLENKMAEERKRTRAGQMVRFMELPADAGKGLGLFENLHNFDNAGQFASFLQEQAGLYYGMAGRCFIEALCQERQKDDEAFRQNLRSTLQQRTHDLVVAHTSSNEGQIRTIAERCALFEIAGHKAVSCGVLPCKKEEVTQAVEQCFAYWIKDNGSQGNQEARQAILQVRHYLEIYGSIRFPDVAATDYDKTAYRSGYRRKNHQGFFDYLILSESWKKEICDGLNSKDAAYALKDAGFLECKETGRLNCKEHISGIGSVRVYIVKSTILENENE